MLYLPISVLMFSVIVQSKIGDVIFFCVFDFSDMFLFFSHLIVMVMDSLAQVRGREREKSEERRDVMSFLCSLTHS